MWHIGQRVVCVDDSGQPRDGRIYPLKGNVYTIRTIEIDDFGGQLAMRFCEIVNQPKQYIEGFYECRFFEYRFRPLDEKRIDIFRAMLKNKEKEKVE